MKLFKNNKKTMTSQKQSRFFFAFFTAVGLFAGATFAQALTISPARAELTGDPGEVVSKTFLLINEQDRDQTFYTSVENFDSQGETGTPNFISSKEGLPSWVTVTDKITLKKGERMTVPYTITIPPTADAGGHFAAIFLSTVPPSQKEGEVSVGAKVGMLVLLRVTGDIKEGGNLTAFSLKDDKKFITNLPVDFVYKFKNDGNDRVKPEGEIVVRNTFYLETGRLDANSAAGNVLPGSVRRFEARLGKEVAPEPSASYFDHVKFQVKNFALGIYFADITLKYGNSSSVASSSLVYFVFPWQLMILVILGIIFTLTVLRSLLNRYNRWIIKQARANLK